MSTFITGFNTLVFLSWTILEMITVIYFGERRAIITFMVMIASLYAWIGLHLDGHHRTDVLMSYLSATGVGVVTAVIASIWRVANTSRHSLEAVHAKEEIERSQLTSLVNSMGDGVVAVDMDVKVVLYNAAALNVLDSNSSMQGKSLRKFLALVDKEDQPVDIVKLIKDTKLADVSRDYRIRYSDGSFANLYFSVAPVHLGYGKQGSQGYVILLRDITREKSLEEERDEFISVVSHELRTPIAISEGNISNAQLIAEKTGDMAQVKSSLEEAHNQILFLADMINDLATLSRAERGKLVLEVESIEVDALVAELAKTYQADAEKKGLQLKSNIPKKLMPLSSSKLYVREVLQNFITNAIKYTEKGSVTLSVSQTTAGTVFEVTDTGIGISKSDQERVFDKFFRSEDYRTRQNSGTGLGLYVTMKLTRLIHADIDVQSQLDKGSTFRITIPDIKQDEASAPAVEKN
jgi:PAS domain S-box-containing protein